MPTVTTSTVHIPGKPSFKARKTHYSLAEIAKKWPALYPRAAALKSGDKRAAFAKKR
jgi:hypothetical protein